jgi:tripartite-type tricarboxylate transporter receptor subunit TctC
MRLVARQARLAPYINSGAVIPIVITETHPFSFDGFGEVPAITQFFPGVEKYMPMSQVLSLLLPEGVPQNVRSKIHEAFNTAVNSDDMRKFIKGQNASFIGLSGDPANEMVRRMESKLSWFIYEQKLSSISPETGGIIRYDN